MILFCLSIGVPSPDRIPINTTANMTVNVNSPTTKLSKDFLLVVIGALFKGVGAVLVVRLLKLVRWNLYTLLWHTGCKGFFRP